MVQLKQKMIETFLKYGERKVLVSKGKTYTGNMLADEVSKESEVGLDMLKCIINLTIDLLSRDRINLNE